MGLLDSPPDPVNRHTHSHHAQIEVVDPHQLGAAVRLRCEAVLAATRIAELSRFALTINEHTPAQITDRVLCEADRLHAYYLTGQWTPTPPPQPAEE